MTYRAYAGIGSRSTPTEVMDTMRAIAGALPELGYTLRSGAAEGADMAFYQGALAVGGQVELFLARPRPSLKAKNVRVSGWPSVEAMNLSSRYHPNGQHLRPDARALHGRNAQIVLGRELYEPVEFVICWTPGGLETGGTAQALRIARAYSVPIFNLGCEDCSPLVMLRDHLAGTVGVPWNWSPDSLPAGARMPPASLQPFPDSF